MKPLDMGHYYQRRGVALTERDRALRASTVHPLETTETRREPTAAEREGAPVLRLLAGCAP